MLPDETIQTLLQAHSNLSKNEGKGTKIATILFTGVEVAGGAALMGGINGRFASPGKDHIAIGGIPVDVTLGAVGILASLFGVFGPSFDTHVAALASGCVAAYAYRKAMEKGSEGRVEVELGRAVLNEGAAERKFQGNAMTREKVVQLVTK